MTSILEIRGENFDPIASFPRHNLDDVRIRLHAKEGENFQRVAIAVTGLVGVTSLRAVDDRSKRGIRLSLARAWDKACNGKGQRRKRPSAFSQRLNLCAARLCVHAAGAFCFTEELWASQPFASLGENGPEHIGCQNAGVGIVAGAVIAVDECYRFRPRPIASRSCLIRAQDVFCAMGEGIS